MQLTREEQSKSYDMKPKASMSHSDNAFDRTSWRHHPRNGIGHKLAK